MSTWSTSVAHQAQRARYPGARCNRLYEQLHPPHSGKDESRLPRTQFNRSISHRWRWADRGGGVQCGQQLGEVFGLGGIFHGRTASS